MNDQGTVAADDGRFDLLHLFVLGGFAVAQPLFSILGDGPTFFVAHRSQPADVWVLVGALLLAPALFLGVLEGIARGLAGAGVRRALHLLFVGFLVAVTSAPLAKRLVQASPAVLGLSITAGLLGAFVYRRFAPTRTFLSVLGPAPLLFAALFVVRPGIPAWPRGEAAPDARPPADTETSLVWVVLDELPLASLLDENGEIDAGLFPHFARLAANSVWFRNATTSYASTEGAVPALLSGRDPKAESSELRQPAPTWQDYPDNVFTWLAPTHRLKVIEVLTDLCPNDEESKPPGLERLTALAKDVGVVYGHVVLPEAAVQRLPRIDEGWRGFGAEALEPVGDAHDTGLRGDRSEPFTWFLDSLDADPEPALWFLHVLLPHQPWTRTPEGKRYNPQGPARGHTGGVWVDDLAPRALALSRHLLQLGYVDRLIGQLLDELQALGIYDRCAVAIVADHGFSFLGGQHNRLPTETSAREILHVPFFLKLPGQGAGRVVDTNVESEDVLPTIAHALGAELGWPRAGRNALADEVPERLRKTIYADRRALEFDAALPAEWPGLARKLEWFGTASSWDDVHAVGPRRSLLGRSVAELISAETTRAQAAIDTQGVFGELDPESDVVPTYVLGHVAAPDPSLLPAEVALAVGGIVRAVVPTFTPKEGRAEFGATLPASAFRSGRNEVEVFAVVGESLVSLESLSYVLETNADGGAARILRSDGVAYTVEAQGGLRGSFGVALFEAGALRLQGWAADIDGGRPADGILFLVGDGKRAFLGSTGVRRQDLVRRFNGQKAIRGSGFQCEFELGVASESEVGTVRAFGLFGSRALELPHGTRSMWVAPSR